MGSLEWCRVRAWRSICTPGSAVAHEICEMTLVVVLLAASDSLTVRSTGVLLVQTLTQVMVLVAVTASQLLVESGEPGAHRDR